jgi:predicted RNA-binding protein with EMAP domain
MVISDIRKRYSLIIGIDEYKDNNIRNLKYCGKDAEKLMSVMNLYNITQYIKEKMDKYTNEKKWNQNMRVICEGLEPLANYVICDFNE